MINKKEVKKLYNVIDHYVKIVNDLFNVKEIDEEDELEVRDWINDPEYKNAIDRNSLVGFEGEVQFFFNVSGLYFRLFIKKDITIIDYVGNEFLDEVKSYYKHNNNFGSILNSVVVGLRLHIQKMKLYKEFHEFSTRADDSMKREVDIDLILND